MRHPVESDVGPRVTALDSSVTDRQNGTSRPMASTADIKNGVVLSIDGQLWSVIEFQHVKPGKGGAFVRTKLKNVVSGKVVDRTYNAGAKIEIENVDRRDFTYLYNDGDSFVFMDVADYDQLTVPATVVGDAKNFMLENQQVQIALNNGNPLYIELPASVVLEITYTEPGLQGDRSSAGTKPATVETGYEIQVPLFLETGTKVKVDTRTGDYLGRVN
jgi:elongation factor P